jgi:hypothetical protein
MTAADKRIEELLARWQASLDLHARYVQLDDAAYARAESWPRHQRPTAWVVDLARKRLLELRDQFGRRQAAGDAAFAEALELMSFLTSLLGSEHIERFIPTATGTPVDPGISATVQQPRVRAAKPRPPQKARATTSRPVARTVAPTAPVSAPTAAPDAGTQQVISDAVRMLGWGREWPALAGLIARMADRPGETDVWKILRTHRAEILARAGRPTT